MIKEKKKLILRGLCVLLSCLCPVVECSALDGSWRGELDLNTAKLPLVFNFTSSADGKTDCTIDSPMQGVKGMAAEVAYCDEDSIAVDIKSIGASFSGSITPAEIKGIFSQLGHRFQLNLTPELTLQERRPQTPRPPYPYTTIDTTFTATDGVVLAATLTLPAEGTEGCPAVVMVSGSGPQNRDEEFFDHRPFAVIADWLARNGIASLRYDDRGTAMSGGDFKTSDIDTFRADAGAAFQFMKGMEGMGKVGILGHSEGGTIALMLGAEGGPDFVVSMAGGICPGKDLILAQNLLVLQKMQLSEKGIADAMQLIRLTFDDIIAGKAYSEIPIDNYIRENSLEVNPIVLASLRKNLEAASGSYFRKLISLNPSEWIGKVKCPVMALNGTLDTQVTSTENLDVVRKCLPGATVKEYPGLNHLFQHAETGEMTEYDSISETISPEVLSDIAAFIRLHSR